MRHAICYVSNSKKELDYHQVRILLEVCREKNMKLGIKGVLLYSDGNFFQILEGEKDIVSNVFNKIEKDPRHYGLNIIIRRDIPLETYEEYKIDILDDEQRFAYEVPGEYQDALQGIPVDVRKTMERMLEKFISSR